MITKMRKKQARSGVGKGKTDEFDGFGGSGGPGGLGVLEIRDRIVELRRVPASELLPHDDNWRTHPTMQKDLMRGALQEVGLIDAVIARDTKDGLRLIDGHMRLDMLEGREDVPVLIVDLTDEEADKALLTFDPIGAMADRNEDTLRLLLERTKAQNAELRRFFANQEAGIEPEVDVPTEEEANAEVPGMALEPHEHYDYLVVLATTTQEWNVLCDKLGLEPEARRKRMGTCRAVRANRLLEALGVNLDEA